jgi:MFS family permease
MSVAASVGGGLVNGGTRITMGTLTDKYSFKLLFGIMMVVQLINSLICFWAGRSGPAFFACVMLNYFSLGGLFAVFPGTVVRTFGKKQGPSVYVLVLIGSFLSSVLNIFATKFLLPNTSFFVVYTVGSGTTILCLVVLYFYEEKLDIEWLKKNDAIFLREREE